MTQLVNDWKLTRCKANVLSSLLRCLLISTSDDNNSSSHSTRCFNLACNPLNNFLSNLVQETLHFTDKQAVKGLKNTRRQCVGGRVLDLKGVSTIKHPCDLRKIRKSPRAVELEGTLMVLVQSSREAENNSRHPSLPTAVSQPPNGKNTAYAAFPHQQVVRIK